MTEYRMWMVWVEGGSAPNKQHWSRLEAETEAGRLAIKERKRVYVLASVGYCYVPEPNVEFTETDEVAPMPMEKMHRG